MGETKAYPKDTAGRVLSENIPVFTEHTKADDAITELLKNTKRYATINYLYLTDANEKLTGVISIKNLLSLTQSELQKPLSDMAVKDVVSVHPYSHQERAAQLALKHNIKAVPVVSGEGQLLGVVESDTILSIMHEEKVEDLLRFAGITKQHVQLDNIISLSPMVSLKHRLPWLIAGLLGGLAIAQTIASFEQVLEKSVIIAAFIPMMVYMSNAVGQQVTAFMIRDSATTEKIPYMQYFVKHFTVVLLIALILSTLLFGFSYVLHGSFAISRVLGIAMFSTVLSSIITGFFIPFIFIRKNMDPANTSGPIGTVIQDFLSVLIYFLVAMALL